MTLVHPECCKPELVDEFETIMAQSGRFDRIGENLADAAGAASGCVPAFAYLFMEGLADGAVMAGVPRQKAMTYVAQAVLGAASLVLQSGQHPGALKDAVCSPGGSTIVGVSKLEEGGLRSACIQAVAGVCGEKQEAGQISGKKGFLQMGKPFLVKRKEQNMTEVVAALIWEGDRFLIGQRPEHKARGLLWEFVGERPSLGKARSKH